MNLPAAFAQAIAKLTPEQALAVYNALAQWTDNQRNFIDEEGDSSFSEVSDADRAQLAAAEAVVEACEIELTAHLDPPRLTTVAVSG